MPSGSTYFQVRRKCHEQIFVCVVAIVAALGWTFLDLSWFFAILVAGEHQQQQLPNSRQCLRLKLIVAVGEPSRILSFSLPYEYCCWWQSLSFLLDEKVIFSSRKIMNCKAKYVLALTNDFLRGNLGVQNLDTFFLVFVWTLLPMIRNRTYFN